ncbi:MAG: Ig-like domain-containing protein [Candidatus Thorarchaeota archaeon]
MSKYSFEYSQWDTASDGLASWARTVGGAEDVSRSTDAFAGKYSANVTTLSSSTATIERHGFYTRMTPSMYIDFSWKIAGLEMGVSGSYAAKVYFNFAGGYYLSYVVGAITVGGFSNGSTSTVYLVDGFNSTGSWHTSHRNITLDLTEAFGDHVWNMTGVGITVYASSSSNVSLLVDNIGLVDVQPPTIISVSHTPTVPMYYQSTEIMVDAYDTQAGIRAVEVTYRTTGAWSTVVATETAGSFRAQIPPHDYGTTVQYYVKATDWCGNSIVDDKGGAYYSYTVGDDVAPTVSFQAPASGVTVVGEILLNATASDAGSGIDYVDFVVDGTSVHADDEAPFEYLWNSRTVSNGTHTVTVVAHDVAGVTANDSIVVNVQNDVAPPELTDVIVSPQQPQYGQDVTVTVGALDVSGVDNVTISYRLNGGSWVSAEMAKNGIFYQYVIPAQAYGTRVDFYVVAYDIFGTYDSIGSKSDPLSYTVTDLIAPALAVNGPSNTEPVRGTVEFQVSAQDAGSGIDTVEFRVDGTLVSQSTGGVIAWDTTGYENGNYTLTFTAIDKAGNSVSYSVEYTVDNPSGVDAITEAFADIMSSYGFFVGAGTIIVLIIMAKLVSRRRD